MWLHWLLALSLLATPEAAPAPSKPKVLRIRSRASGAMGVRGLEAVDLQKAAPDEKQLALLETFVPTAESMAKFPREGGRSLVAVLAGDKSLPQAPPDLADEEKLGREVAASLLGAAPLLEDPKPQHYVNQVGAWLAAVSERPKLKWRFAILKTDAINAFAIPGGFVFLTLGLYQRLGSESQLAGVLAHEISHVVARHHFKLHQASRAIEKATEKLGKMPLGMAALNRMKRQLVGKTGELMCRALDKSAELDADERALSLAGDSGYEPSGLPKVLKILDEQRGDDDRTSLLRHTHPHPRDRLRIAEALLTQGRLSSLAQRPDMTLRFARNDLKSLKTIRKSPGT